MIKNETKQPTRTRRSTLSTQLTIRIVLFVAVSVVIMTVYSIYTIQNSITELSMTALTDETESCVNSLDIGYLCEQGSNHLTVECRKSTFNYC
ncbi:MAG: hypothetical protein HDT30_11865 [Clostridiales bacterium]|nr:hypothetical protein [Clostridiales bacterium]